MSKNEIEALCFIAKVSATSVLNDRSPVFPRLMMVSELQQNQYSERDVFALPRLYVGTLPSRSGIGLHDASLGKSKLRKGARVGVTPEQAHYLTKVLRINPSNSADSIVPKLRVFDGVNGEWLARVERSDISDACRSSHSKMKKKMRRPAAGRSSQGCYVMCIEQIRFQDKCVTSSFFAPWVIFGAIKKSRAKQLVEKCTELGAGAFIPVQTDRSEKRNVLALASPTYIEKLTMQAIEASEQCERLSVPQVFLHPFDASCEEIDLSSNRCSNLREILSTWKEKEGFGNGKQLLVCRERAEQNETPSILNLLKTKKELIKTGNVAFLVGPEGGWSDEEEALFDEKWKYPFLESVSFGDSVLRTETAAMMAVGSLMLVKKIILNSNEAFSSQ